MNTKSISYLTNFILLLAGGFYIYGVFSACKVSWGENEAAYKAFSPNLSFAVTTIAGILATNFGAVLGITISNPLSRFRNTETWNPLNFFSATDPKKLQVFACYFYIFTLLAAGIVWAHQDFDDAVKAELKDGKEIITLNFVPLVFELSKTLIGVLIGTLTLVLNTKPDNGSIKPD